MSRDRLILNLALVYLHHRGALIHNFPLSRLESIDHELKVTPAERAEAIEIADSLEEYFSDRP